MAQSARPGAAGCGFESRLHAGSAGPLQLAGADRQAAPRAEEMMERRRAAAIHRASCRAHAGAREWQFLLFFIIHKQSRLQNSRRGRKYTSIRCNTNVSLDEKNLTKNETGGKTGIKSQVKRKRLYKKKQHTTCVGPVQLTSKMSAVPRYISVSLLCFTNRFLLREFV